MEFTKAVYETPTGSEIYLLRDRVNDSIVLLDESSVRVKEFRGDEPLEEQLKDESLIVFLEDRLMNRDEFVSALEDLASQFMLW